MKVVVTGGGTGGHIYPALAVAEAMRNDPAVEAVIYLGKEGGLESELVPQAGIPFEGIDFYGMPRGKSPLLPFRLLKWWLALRTATSAAKTRLQAIRPAVVFGTGGYVSAPVLMAARQLKVPCVIHEPDAHPGLVNRLMARHAALVTTSFEAGAHQLAQGGRVPVKVTGNPIRGQLGRYDKARALAELGVDWPAGQTVLLVTGGSQGARSLNQAVAQALPELLDGLQLAVIHLTGRKLYEETLAPLPEVFRNHPRYRIQPYEPEMARLMGAADLALCRAGSLSLSEMYVSGLPTLLVPYPHAAADHQRKNAEASVAAGASVLIPDSECTGPRITAELRRLLEQPDALRVMGERARALAHPHATEAIVRCLKEAALDPGPCGH